MGVLIQSVADFAPYVYAACAAVALWYLRVAILARRERRRAIFSLEREAALNRIYNGYGIAFTLLIVIGILYFVSNFLVRVMPPSDLDLSTPTVTVAAFRPTPTDYPTAEPTFTATPAELPTPRPRPTPRPTPPPPSPTAPEIVPPACPLPGVRITAPGIGTKQRGAIQVFGTANIEDFWYYKLEFKEINEPGFKFIMKVESPVVNGLLGSWDNSGLPAGTYLLQLVVVDKTGNYPDPCITRIVVP